MKKIYSLIIVLVIILTAKAQETDFHMILVGSSTFDNLASVEPGDQNLYDSLSSWLNVSYYEVGEFNTACGTPEVADTLFAGVDGVLISESIGSAEVPNFGPDGLDFPVPSIVFEMSCFENETNKWNMFTETGGGEGHGTPTAGDLQWVIIDNLHYITEIYTIEQVVDYAVGEPGRGMAYLYGFKDPTVNLAKPNSVLENAEAVAIAVIDDNILFMSIGKTYPAVDVATQDFFTVLRRGVEYMFDAIPVSVDKVTWNRKKLSFFPNPASQSLNVTFPTKNRTQAEISLIDATGKIVKSKTIQTVYGVNSFQFDLSGVNQGIYFLQLNYNNEIVTEKVMVK